MPMETDNLFIGPNSGNGTTTGTGVNIAVGSTALDALTTGDNNVAIGTESLTNDTTGSANTAIGRGTLRDNIGGSFNVAIGQNTSVFNTGGVRNTAVGTGAISNMLTGAYNCALGNASGANFTTTESDNIAIMSRGVIGDNNTIRIGTQGTGDGQQDTTFIAGIAATTAAGAVTGTVLTDANGQLGTVGDIIGTNNLNLPTTNAALDEGVIEINSVRMLHAYGTSNIFVGASGNGTTTGSGKNVGIGAAALDSLTTGNSNMAIGSDALTACTEGLGNVAIGADVLERITEGDYNIGIGFVCCPWLTTGVRNTCIGVGALGGAGVTSASYNVCIGNASGNALTTTDSDNITIMNTGVATDNNTIRIGTQGTGDGQQDSCFIAGIHGVTPGAATQTVIIDANGELGSTASAGGGFTWNEVAGTTQAAAINNGYVSSNGALVTITLPDTAAFGSVVKVMGKGAGGWRIAQNAGETIRWDEATVTTTGVGGSLESTDDHDYVELICTTADTVWTIGDSKGNIDVT